MAVPDDEEQQLRSVALQNANSILLARQRAEDELLRTKEALRESQERLNAALTAAGTGTFRWNLPANTVEWDGNLDRLFGFESHGTTPSLDAFFATVHPDDRPGVMARCEACARDGSDFDMEFRVVWPDGSVHWIDDKAKTFLDQDGTPLYVTGACADVTSRKQGAETLRENDERLRAIFNQAAVGIAVATLDGHFLRVNKKFSDILGYSSDELERLTFSSITHPDDRRDTTTAIGRLLDGSIAEYSLEKRYLRKDGVVVWSLTTVTLLTDAAGRPERFIGVIEDITRRKHAEAALREETRILELLNETGNTLASQLDLHAVVQAVTDAATQLSGARCGAFFYKGVREHSRVLLFDTFSGAAREAFEGFGNPRTAPLFVPTLRGDAPIRSDDLLTDARFETMARSSRDIAAQADGCVRSYLAVAVRSRSGEVIGGLFFGHSQPQVFSERAERLIVGVAAQAGIAIDNARLFEAAQKAADERKSLLESERAARTEAERMSDLKDEFLATLSHELRTPLNAILGWSQVLRSTPRDGADLVKGLEAIERNARVQTQLIEDLLDMSRITSGKLRLDIQPLQPMSFIEAALETVKPAADAKGIRLEKLLDPAAGPISGDPGRLQQVVWNLLSNAIKFTPRDGKVQVVLERVGLAHRDERGGYRHRHQAGIHSRICSSDSARRTRRPRASTAGLGLGLSIVKSLVELHGGTVSVESAGEGQGTTVTVHLPLTVVRRRPDTIDLLHPKTPPRQATRSLRSSPGSECWSSTINPTREI